MRSTFCWAMLLIAMPGAAHAQMSNEDLLRSTPDRRSDETETPAANRPASPGNEEGGRSQFRFRRVYVPESELNQRVKEGQRYVPMDASDFSNRVRQLTSSNPSRPKPSAQIVYARYTATLDSSFRMTGDGEWQVTLPADKPQVLTLDDLGVALQRPRWVSGDDPKDGASITDPALLGGTEHGSPALYVDRDGTVAFDWSVAGTSGLDKSWTYKLSFPQATSHRLELRLPKELEPAMEGAIISQAPVEGGNERHWTLDLVGQNSAQLRLVSVDESNHNRPDVLLKPRLTYELSTRGLQLTADYRLDVLGGPIHRVEFDVDSTLTVLSVSLGDTPVPWTLPARADKDSPQRLVVRFSEPLRGQNRTLRVVAIAPLRTDPGWRLPGMFPRDAIWQDGSAVLVVAAPLSLRQLDLTSYRQTKRETLPAPAAGEAIEIQAFATNAEVRLHVAPFAERLELTSATTVELLGDEAVGVYTADITARQGNCFELAADISPEWIVDSVQSSPAGLISDWRIGRESGTASRLIIQLVRAIDQKHPLRLRVDATRRRAPLGDTLSLADLKLLSFENVATVRRLACLKSAPSFRLDVLNAPALTRLDPDRLAAADRALFDDVRQGLLFAMDEAAGDLQIRLSPERPRFSASLDTHVTLRERDLFESHQLRINPESNEIDRLLVHFSQARDSELVWEIDQGAVAQVTARRLSVAAQSAQGYESGETWEVVLKPSRNKPFVLICGRPSQMTSEMPISLPSVREATSQQGSVAVELKADFIPELQVRGLKPLAVEPESPARPQGVAAAYEYDPGQDLVSGKESALLIKNDRTNVHRRSAWIWHCRLDLWMSASRAIRQRATYLVENQGRSQFSVTLPSGAMPSVKLDGASTNEVRWNQQSGSLEVRLPALQRFCRVEVNWNAGESSLGSISSRSVVWPTADIPILNRHANVWLPAGYFLADFAGVQQVCNASSVGWRERVFGMLGRPQHRTTFEPWNVDDWSQLGGASDDDLIALQWTRRFINQTVYEESLRENRNASPGEDSAWGSQLYRAWYRGGGGDTSPPIPLLVHSASLEQSSIRPSRPLLRSIDASPDHRLRIADLLRRHGLVVLVSSDTALLTTRQWAATWCDHSIASSAEIVIHNADGNLLARPFTSPDDAARQLLPLETWLAVQAPNGAAWNSFDRGDGNDLTRDGWVAYSVAWPANDQPLQLLIIQEQTLWALSAGVLLFAAGLGWRLAAWPLVLRIVVLGVLAMMALLLPAQFTALGAAAVLGFLAGLSGRSMLAPAARVSEVERVPRGVAAVAPSVMLFALLWMPALNAQQPAPLAGEVHSTPIYDVLIPMDTDENLVGDKVYVPEALYAALLAPHEPQLQECRYLITSAVYEAPVAFTAEGAQTSAAQDWQAILTIETLKAPARVFIPLGSAGAQIVPDSATLNGRPLRFGWDDTRNSITFDLEATGAGEVQFKFRPKRHEDTETRTLSFAIPKVPQSKLIVPLDPKRAVPGITAQGGHAVLEHNQLVANLGPLEEARLVSRSSSSTASSPSQFDSQELNWLTVRPGSALLNARFTVHVRRGSLREVLLSADKRLIPLPPPAGSPITSIHRLSGEQLLVRFARPLTETSTLDLAFAVQGTSGAGRYTWPKLELIGSLAAQRYIAYTLDPSLELTTQPPAQIKPLNAAEFATLWGETEARPPAFELPPAAPRWDLEVRPRLAKLTSRSQAIVTAHADHAELQWLASLDISSGSRFQLRLAVPPDLAVDRLDVRDAAGARPARWALSESGSLTVFLETATTGRLNLELGARVPAGRNGRVSVPLLRIDGGTVEQSQLAVARRFNVLLSIENRAGFRELERDSGEALLAAIQSSTNRQSATRRERLVATFDTGEASQPLELTIKRNRPHVNAVQAVSLSRPNDSWQAAIDLALNVSEGVVDTVRIELPMSWSEPFEIEPNMPYEVLDVAGESRRHLVLRPPQPISGATHIRLEGRLTPTVAGRVRAPDARLLGATSLEQYVVLPEQQELQTLAWETSGMKRAELPENLARLSATAPETVQTYLLAADSWRAELRSVDKIADEVQVRLADIAVHWTREGACYGAATFDVEPAGRADCLLALPAAYQLIHASVDQRPIRIVPAGNQRWRIPLGGRLPQRIEVVFTGQWSADDRTPTVLEAPKLIGLPIERTLWTVSGPWWAGSAAVTNADRVTPSILQARRYETLAGLVDSAANTLMEIAAEETPRWYTTWVRRMITSRETLARMKLLGPTNEWDLETTASTDFVLQDQQRLAKRLATSDLLAEILADPPPDDSASATFHASLARSHGALEAMFLGEASAIELDYTNPLRGDLPWRIVHVLVAAALLLAVVALVRHTTIVAWLAARPRVVGIAVGAFWWLFLFPSAAGWPIIAVSIVAPYLSRLTPRRPQPLKWRWRA